jgi:Na+/H+ antiporter NhaC
MSSAYAVRTRSSTPYALMAFFAIIILAILAATAMVQMKAADALQSEAADRYVPVDEDVPVTDAVVEAQTNT